MFRRTNIAMVVAEFLGTATLTAVVLAVSKSGVGFSIFIASAVGFAFTLLVLAIGQASNNHFNPAVTLGLWTVRKIRTVEALVYLVAQFLGAFATGKLYVYLTKQKLNNIAAKSFDWRVLIAEGVGAFILTFGITSALYQGYRGLKLAVTLGGALFLGALVASLGANGLVNPAIAAGIRSWDVAYAVGPIVGAVVGANLYAWLFAPALVTTAGTVVVAPVRKSAGTTRKVAAKKPAARGRQK